MYKWKNNSPLKSIYGAEAILLSKNILEKYIEISVNIKNKMIDEVVMDIVLKMKTKIFVNLWNNKNTKNNLESLFIKMVSSKAGRNATL